MRNGDALLLCLALLASSCPLWAQEREPAPPSFSVTSNLVRLLVTVRDQATSAIVTNLGKDDFRVFDDTVEQTISVFERNTSLPLSIALLIDTSGSTNKDIAYETGSILKFLRTLKQAGNPDDALAVYSFNWQVKMDVGYTRNEQRAERAMRQLHGEGGTSLYDAIYLVSSDLADRDGRHVMVVVTDGGDTTSYKKFEDAVKAAMRSEAVLYPIVVVPIENDAGRNTGGEHALETMAHATGGRTFYPAGAGQLDQAFTEILRELRTEYLLGYYPRLPMGITNRYHAVRVTVRRPELKVITRSGYYEQ
ncbi:MAG TPA: VWA domain-containing protein [Bryobacteraceae bacterium]|nr:VWA domain-containing protein [Bryobacteraceae bacterium]